MIQTTLKPPKLSLTNVNLYEAKDISLRIVGVGLQFDLKKPYLQNTSFEKIEFKCILGRIIFTRSSHAEMIHLILVNSSSVVPDPR